MAMAVRCSRRVWLCGVSVAWVFLRWSCGLEYSQCCCTRWLQALYASGPYALEAEDDELSIELKLEEERQAREKGGQEAVVAMWEAEMSIEGRIKAFCRCLLT